MSRALAHTGGARGEGHDLVVHLRDVAARREDLQRERNLVIQSSREIRCQFVFLGEK